jgi:aspartate/methionine/tyrosine aminotransferase
MPEMPELSKTASAIRAGVFAELERAVRAHAARGGSLVPLQIGDTHLPPPPEARFDDACKARSTAALYAYGATAGLEELRAVIAARLDATGRALPNATEANVLVGVGATHALFCAARSILDPGDDVLLAAPYWPLAHGILTVCGANPIEVPLTSRLYADPSLDAGALLAAAATPRTRAVYLITPNNPDGKVLSPRDLESIAAFARARDLWVFADEVYADYTYDNRMHVSIARLPGMSERTLSAYSFSKSHALAGARVGCIVGPDAVIAAARRVSVHSVFNVPVVSQHAALRALDARAWMDEARAEYIAARDLATAALRSADIDFHVAEGGVYHFCDFARQLGERPVSALLERAIEHGVMLAPGAAFGAAYARCARLCYTSVPRPALERGLDGLIRAVREL